MSRNLIRGLGPFDATAIVIGTIIGTGVFLKTATMAQLLGSPGWVISVWIFAGLLSFTGALSYAELGAMLPDAGGEYVYLREVFGPFLSFLYGWMRFWIGGPGSIAAYAVGAMTFLGSAYDLSVFGGKTAAAILSIAVFTVLNCFTVAFGGKVQSFLTALKLIMLVGLTGGIFLFSQSASAVDSASVRSALFPGFSQIGSAMLAALWAYDGWNNLPMVAGEIKNPQRNLPRALGLGMLVIVFIYLGTNFAYFHALPLSEVVSSNSNAHPDALPVATKAALTFLGEKGVILLSLAFVLSAIGAMNGSILTGARVPFAMAEDGLFFKVIAKISKSTSVPYVSILVQGGVASLLALSGTFDQLTDYVVFASWIFYALCTAAVIVLRKRWPERERPYQTFGYPVVPVLFLIVAVLLLFNTLATNPMGSGFGLCMILAGVPVYFYFKKKRTTAIS